MIVLIDRVFVLAHPAPHGRTLKVGGKSLLFFFLKELLLLCIKQCMLFCWPESCLLYYFLQEDDREKLFEAKIQQIEVKFFVCHQSCFHTKF